MSEWISVKDQKAPCSEEVFLCAEKLRKLNDWPKNWDSYSAAPPNKKAIDFSINFLKDVFDISYTLGRPWASPNISADSNGDVLLEWWGKDDKKITLYLNQKNKIEYIRSCTPNINDMDSNVLNNFNIDAYQKLFGWLYETSDKSRELIFTKTDSIYLSMNKQKN